jgi:hypothetical protein
MTQSLIAHTGDDLAVGDTIQVVFTVTIDPDASGTSSSGLENTATSTGTGINPDTNAPDPTLVAMDTSDNGTDPLTENGEDDMDGTFGNDPTPVIIPDISVVKEVVGTPTPLANGNFEVTYSLVIENTGNVDLANLTLVEDLSTQFGTALISAGNATITVAPTDAGSSVAVDSAWDGSAATELLAQTATTSLAVGDSFTVQFTTEVDPNAVGAPATLDNQVTVGGDAVDANGDPIEDSSGNPIVVSDDSDSGSNPNGSNPDALGDMGTSDDPTPLLIADIGLAKEAGDAVVNGENFDVPFTLVFENTGNADLTNLSLFDDVAAQFGNAFISASNLAVQNFVGTGTAPTANAAWIGDTTQNLLVGGAADVGDTFEVVFTVTIDPNAVGAANPLGNQATANGDALDNNGNPLLDSNGDPITAMDSSDNGTDAAGENGEDNGDGTYGNDPTPIHIADLGIAKSLIGDPVLTEIGNYVVTYQLVVENTGTVNLGSLSLLEDLSAQFGSAFVAAGNLTLVTGPSDPDSNIMVDSAGFNGSSSIEIIDAAASKVLTVGDSFTVTFDVEIDPAGVTAPLENQVSGSGNGVDENGGEILDSNGNPIAASDLSDSGVDPESSNPDAPDDQRTFDDPTLFDPPPVPTGEITGTVFVDDNNDGIQQPGELGIADVEITLTGTDVFGNPVSRTVLTDANGNYTFDNLQAGTYTVTQTQPEGYTDGIDTGLSGAESFANDTLSQVNLGFGETVDSGRFGERRTGAAGNPPNLPGLGSILNSPVSSLLQSVAGGPGPIYSGIPINANADPLSLDSGRAVSGGYAVDGTVNDCDCGCPEPINPCCQPVDPCGQTLNWTEEMIEQPVDCGCEGEVIEDGQAIQTEGELIPEDSEVTDAEQIERVDQAEIPSPMLTEATLGKTSLLKRMSNWLVR